MRSVTLDEWRAEWVHTMDAVGNARSNAYYEHSVPEEQRYLGGADLSGGGDRICKAQGVLLEHWIRAKYEEKRFAPAGSRPPHEDIIPMGSEEAAEGFPTAQSASWGSLHPLPEGQRRAASWSSPRPSSSGSALAAWGPCCTWPNPEDQNGSWSSASGGAVWDSSWPKGAEPWPVDTTNGGSTWALPQSTTDSQEAPDDAEERMPSADQASSRRMRRAAAGRAALLHDRSEEMPRLASVFSGELGPPPQVASCFPCILGVIGRTDPKLKAPSQMGRSYERFGK